MANYSLVINSKFKPFSYQELLAPALMSTQAHQELEEAYTDMSIKANIWDQMADKVRDEKTHTIYKKYADDLEARAQSLARYGISPSSRQDLLTMRSRYAKEIVPIENAYKRREADIAAQKEAMTKDPTHFFNRMAKDISLDEYLNNQALDVISDNYSGALLMSQVSQGVSNIKDSLMKRDNLKKLGLPYQYERMLQYGATPDQVLAAMREDPDALPILTKIVDNVLEASGIRKWSSMNGDWENNDLYKQAKAWAMQGLFSAIGTQKFEYFTDEFSKQNALNKLSEARQQEQLRQNILSTYNPGPTTYYSPEEVAKMNKKTKAELDKWRKMKYFNSKGELTVAGWNALQLKVKKVGAHRIHVTSGDPHFVIFAKSLGVDPTKKNHAVASLSGYYKNTMEAISNGKLPIGTANFDVYRQTIQGDESNLLASKILHAIGEDGEIHIADKLTDGSITEGEGITAKEFKKLVEKSPILYAVNSPTTGIRTVNGVTLYGQQLVELENGTKFLLPDGVLDNISELNLSNANLNIRQSGSAAETAVNLSNAGYNLASLYTKNIGEDIKVNDGKVKFNLVQ